MSALTNEEKIVVNSELQKVGKNKVLAYVLLIFLGGFGVHRIYLGKVGSGVTIALLNIIGWATVWFFIGYIPLLIANIWWFIDLFLTSNMVDEANADIELKIEQDVIANR